MSSSGNSQLEGLRDAAASAIFSAFDTYGWVIPAALLVVLLLGACILISVWTDGLEIDFPIFESAGGIFRSTRRWWHAQK